MRSARDTLVMLLAGGVGSRLNILASERAKPAVPFGGGFRIIDFTLSNVMHSGLELVGLLTQYRPLSLMDHVRNGEPWDLIGRQRGVKILPPHTGKEDSDWYKGTADAIYQNLAFVQDYKPDKVLILSGDHIYRMDYEEMIAAHEVRGADVTIAAMPVPWEDTHRFGVIVAKEDGSISDFQEKVRNAKSNLASMGVYVFNFAALVEELRAVVGTRKGYDFGKDIIPGMLGRRELLCHPFAGYWRDVGTIKSYHEANMDCLNPDSGLGLESWEIRTAPDVRHSGDGPPTMLGSAAAVTSSLIGSGCVIEGEVAQSVLFPGVEVKKGAVVRDSIVMQDTLVGAGCRVEYSIIDKQCRLGAGAVIGSGTGASPNRKFPTHLDCGISVIGKGVVLPDGARVGKNCIIYPGVDLTRRKVQNVDEGETIMT
ncbi:MAG TPA: sugar phosphate nucleotidyltransferase [Candidatus Methylomirabilis sp.]|nr:sugar phosphate nucleotidyltransferase [Candidatus Methylomirabilis sp.]